MRFGNEPYGAKEASGPEFSMGSVRGYRNWHVTDEGVLLGSVQRTPWVSGTNIAECTAERRMLSALTGRPQKPRLPVAPTPPPKPNREDRRHRGDFVFRLMPDNSTSWNLRATAETLRREQMEQYEKAKRAYEHAVKTYAYDLERWEQAVVEWERQNRDGHRTPELSCVCGFYALSDPDNPEFAITTGPGVWGIMEGYGKTLVGEKGFRSEKGKILAVVVPPSEPEGNTKGGFDFDFDEHPTTGRYQHTRFLYPGEDRVQADLFYKDNVLPPDLIARVQARYPEVAIYPTKSALLAEFGVDA